jgi:hypothetical protein
MVLFPGMDEGEVSDLGFWFGRVAFREDDDGGPGGRRFQATGRRSTAAAVAIAEIEW